MIYNNMPYTGFNNWNNTAVSSQYNPNNIQNELVVVMVNDESAVQNYPVAVGNSVLLLDYNHKKFWIKSMTNGVTPNIVEHDFEVVDNSKTETERVIQPDEFDKLKETVDEMKKFIEDLKS